MKHYHPIYALRFLRKTLVLYLLPLIQVLFARDWAALWSALRQDLVLFLLLSLISWVILRSSSWTVTGDGVLHLRWDFIFRTDRVLCAGDLAALTVERPLFFRLAGASRVTLYPTGTGRTKAVTLCLTRRDAQWLADRLMPPASGRLFTPTGGEKLALTLLGANSLSTLVLLLLALRQSRQYGSSAEALALAQLSQAAAWAAHWLPAGLAWLLVVSGLLVGFSLLRSFGHTARYQVWRAGGLVGSRGGLIRRYDCRIRADRLSYAEVRLSPVARLLRRYPIYLAAGCYAGEFPLFVCRAGQEQLLQLLLPGFRMPPETPVDTRRRSLIFFAPSGGALALCLLLTAVSRYTLPALTLPLLFLAGVCLFFLLCALVGYRREGAWIADGRLVLCLQQRTRLRCVCVFHPGVSLAVTQSPWAVRAGRANLLLAFPGRLRLKVRSIRQADAHACADLLDGTKT